MSTDETKPDDGEDATRHEDDPEEATDTPTEEGGDGDERPPIEDDERADIDLSAITDEINEEEGGDTPTEEGGESPDSDTDGDTQDEGGEDPPEQGGSDPSGATVTWGDQYVSTLSMLLPQVAEEMSGDPCEMGPDDIADLAKSEPVCLDEQVDRLAAEMGGAKDLPPGQAVVVSTAILAGTVLVQEGDLVGNIAGAAQQGGEA